MTNDDFLDGLRSDWNAAVFDPERLRLVTARRRRRAVLRLAADVVGAVIATIAAVWFILTATRRGEPLYWLGAAAMLLVPPTVAANWMRAWRNSRADYGATTISVLDHAKAHARADLRLTRGGYYTVVILLACSVIAWVLQPFSAGTWRETAWLSATWAAIAILTWLWVRRRVRLLRAELESYERHSQELGREDP
jgi:hypothetical protein